MNQHQPGNAPGDDPPALSRGDRRAFVAFFGRHIGRGLAAAEKYNLRAESILILAMLLFGALIVAVAFHAFSGKP